MIEEEGGLKEYEWHDSSYQRLALGTAKTVTCRSVKSVVVDYAVYYPVEFLHTLNPVGISKHCLTLEIGTAVMLLKNLDSPKFCNGISLQITAL